MKKTEYQYPSEEVKLPSKGLLYPKDSPLRKGFIEMKYMTAKEEDILSNANFIQNGTVIDKLLKSLITSPIDYNELLAGDKNALLVAARILGYGSDYEFSYAGEDYTIDLTKIEDKELSKNVTNVGKNEFDFTLPASKIKVTFKLLTHGDEKGLRLPPKIAPIQVIVIPISKNDQQAVEVKAYLDPILLAMDQSGIRVQIDWSDNSPGFKFNEWEMKGVPLRLEVGPKDIKEENVVIVRRDNSDKKFVNKESIIDTIISLLDDVQKNMFNKAKSFQTENTFTVSSYDEFKDILSNKGGFIKCGWDGTSETEAAIKNETKATIRVIPMDENPKGLNCIYSGKPAKHEVIFAKAY